VPTGRPPTPAPSEGEPVDDAAPNAKGDVASAGEEPLAADAPFVELDVEGFEPAIVSLPLGARSPRPLLVATHGAGGRATIHCRLWRGIVGDRGFVLCPRGRSMYPALSHLRESGYYYPGHPHLAREMKAAISALVARFGDYVDAEGPIFAGYSQGASMGALVLPEHEASFSAAALVEGGVGQNQEWTLAAAERFRRAGGRRVLLVCGRAVCRDHAQRSARLFERAGLGARVLFAAGAGHTYGGDVQRRVTESFPWLVEGDGRWSPAGEDADGARVSRTSSRSGSPSVSGSARRSRTTTR
jgi:predicted esterase